MYNTQKTKRKAKQKKQNPADVVKKIDAKIAQYERIAKQDPYGPGKRTAEQEIGKLLQDKQTIQAYNEQAQKDLQKKKAFEFMEEFKQNMLSLGTGQMEYGGYIPKALYGLTEDPDENPYDKGTQEWTEWEGDSTTDSGGDPAKGTQNWATQNTGGTGAGSGGITTGTTTVKRKPLLGDWGENMLGDLLKYGPTIYNLGRGALDKTTKFPFQGNPYAEQVKKKAEESEKLMNPDSLMNENRKYLNYLKYIAKTKGNPSSYIPTILSGLTKTEEANRLAVFTGKEKLAGIKGKNLRSLMALGEYDRKETLGNKELTLKAEEMQNKMVKAGLTGASKLRFNEELMAALAKNDDYKVRILDKWLNDPSGKGLNELIDSLT